MADKIMKPSVVRSFLSYRWILLSIGGVTFLLLATAIFLLVGPLTTIRSAIDIGSFTVNGKDELLDVPDLVAKRIPVVYVPLALLELGKKGVPAPTLSALRNSTAESIGRTVALQSVIDPSAETDAKQFQQNVLDQIIGAQKRRSDFIREGIAARTVLAKKSTDDLSQQITNSLKASNDFEELSDELRASLRSQREDLAAQQARDAQQPPPSSTDDTKRSRELISAQLNLLASLSIERTELARDLMATRTEHASQESALAEAQLLLKSINETRVSLAPERATTTERSRPLKFLFIAAVASILVMFAAAALLHNFAETKT